MSTFKPTCFQMAVFFATILQLSRYEPGNCQQQLSVAGPRNLTRYEHEANVYIPCPFSGSSNPIWRINGIDYEAFNLPFNMLPVSYGLLIPSVELGMDGKSFQCIIQPEQLQELRSSIGILKVEKVPQEYSSWYHEDNTAIQTFVSSTLSINHQKTLFDADNKNFTWNMDSSCNNVRFYRVISTNCEDITIRTWSFVQATNLTIPSSFLEDSFTGESFYFALQSITFVDGSNFNVCNSLPLYFAVKRSDITEKKSVPYSGTCVDVTSETGSPTIVLPNKISTENDCPCSIIVMTSNNLTTCSCIRDTIFVDSIRVSISEQTTNRSTYNICFHNLTNKMNNTIIHFYDLFRYCTDSNHVQSVRPFRMYLMSMKIVIELPYSPVIWVKQATGEVIFSSDTAEGIELDHYELTLRDVTNFVINHRTTPHNMNSTSFGDAFQEHTCSPYNVTVSAYSILGNSISNSTLTATGNSTNECACIAKYVDVELDFIVDDESQQPEIGVQLQVNCTQNRYENSIPLQVVIQQDGINITATPIDAICEKIVTYYRLDKFLECGKAYNLIPYWISGTKKQCDLRSENFNKELQCSEKKKGGTNIVVILIVVSSVSGIVLLICASVICALSITVRKQKK